MFEPEFAGFYHRALRPFAQFLFITRTMQMDILQ